MSASIAASWSSPSMATVAPWSAATARSVSANATSGWNDADLGAGAHRRREDLRPERAAGVDHRLAAVHPERAGQRGDGVVRDGQDDQLDLVEDRLRVGEDAGAPRRASGTARAGPASRLATAWIGQPARLRATPSAVPTAPAPTIPMIGGSPGPAWTCGWAWSLGCVSSSWRWSPAGPDRGRCRPPRSPPASPRDRRFSGSSPGRSPQPRISGVAGRPAGFVARPRIECSEPGAVAPGRSVYWWRSRPGAGAPARRRLTPRTRRGR